VAVVENMASYAAAPSLRPNDPEAWAALTLDFQGVLALADHELDAALDELEDAHRDGDAPATAKSGQRGDDVGRKRATLLALVARERALACKGEDVQVFGKGHRQRLSNMWGIENTIQLPLDADAAKVTRGGGGG
jgi:hypothetical protein